MRLFSIALLAASILVNGVAGFDIKERALTVADLPPCGVGRLSLQYRTELINPAQLPAPDCACCWV